MRDIEKARARKRRFRERLHVKRYGPGAGDMRGKHGRHARAAGQARWNDGIARSSHGYLKIAVGKGHPLADPNGYAYAHLLVWVSAGRKPPRTGEALHHVNRTKTDNRLENLARVSVSSHAKEHNRSRQRDALGRFR